MAKKKANKKRHALKKSKPSTSATTAKADAPTQKSQQKTQRAHEIQSDSQLESLVESQIESGFAFPKDSDALHAWLVQTIGITLPRRAVLEGHTPPFAYIEHVFFEAGALLASAAQQQEKNKDQQPLDCVLWANRGGGKTFLGAVATMLDLVFKPGIEIRILGGSLEQSKRMLSHLRTLFAHETLVDLVDGRITERRVRLRNGSVVEVLAQSETSVRGTRVQKLRCDEVELFEASLWEAAQLVTRSRDITLADGRTVEVCGSIEALSTMHRPYGLMHKIVEEAKEGQRALFRWGVVDVLEACPDWRECDSCSIEPECKGRAKETAQAGQAGQAGHIRIADALRMKSRVGQASWDAEMLCERPRRSDSVFPEFDTAVHVVGDGACWKPPEGTLLAGMDFGFRAPTVVLWAVLDNDDRLWVLAERVLAETVLSEHARALLEGPKDKGNTVDGIKGPPEWVGVDPAGRQRNDQTGISPSALLRKAGLTVRDRRLGMYEGLNLVRARLKPAAEIPPGHGVIDANSGGVGGGAGGGVGGGVGGSGSKSRPTPKLFVHARCGHLIECLSQYHYPADRPESMSPEKDGFDHAADALRYLVQSLDRPYETNFKRY